MIIITKDNISNYLTDQDINIIDKNINKKIYFSGLNGLIKDNKYKKDKKDKKDKKCKIIYSQKYYFISILYINHYYNNQIILINNNNFNDIIIYIKYINKDWYCFNIIKNIDIFFYCYNNRKIIDCKNKIIEYNYNYKLIQMCTKAKKIFLNYYYIYYNYNNYYALYYSNNYFLFILKISKYRNYIRIKYNLNNNINNLLFFVYI